MSSRTRKALPPTDGSKPGSTVSSSSSLSQGKPGKKLLISEDCRRTSNSSSSGINVKLNSTNSKGGVDKGARIAEAVKAELRAREAAAAAASDGGNDDESGDGYTYRDPAPLKWRIFEAVAKTNGQRAFATYWSALRDFMSGWLPREDLDEALLASLGAENVHLHNDLILCLLNNARCRYLPVELMPHVPASCRGEVVRRRAGDVEALPSASPTSPSSNGGASLPFQGKRKDGILPMKFEGGPVAAVGAAAAGVRRGPIGIDDNHGSAGRPNALVKLEAAGGAGGASRKGLAPPPPPPPPGSAAKGVGGLGSGGGGRGGPARHGKELLIAAAPGTTRRSVEASGRSSEQSDEVSDEQLMDEIEAQFGAGSDIWRPWSLDAVEEEGEQQESGRKRPGSWAGSEAGGRERSLKSRKGERGGVMTCASAGAGALVGCAGAATTGGKFLELAASEAAEKMVPIYRSQRVPGARALAPFLQALTASQQMKVSHEVCRAMTAGVKEYLRRIIEACLTNARSVQQRQKLVSGGVSANGTSSRAGTNPTASGLAKQAKTPTAVVPKPPDTGMAIPGSPLPGKTIGVLTPGNLRRALETSPRLAGPPSSTRAQWRRVATFAGEYPPIRGVSRSGAALY